LFLYVIARAAFARDTLDYLYSFRRQHLVSSLHVDPLKRKPGFPG
jgi:hypothetical protein